MAWKNIQNGDSASSVANSLNNLGIYVDALDSTNVALTQDTSQVYSAPDVEGALIKLIKPYTSIVNAERELANLIAKDEVANNIRSYSNYFYDLFYANQNANRIGKIDDRYLTYNGALGAGVTSINPTYIDATHWGDKTPPYINYGYNALTVDDGTNNEIVYMSNIGTSFDSKTYVGAYPKTVSLGAGTYTFALRGGKGKDYIFQTGKNTYETAYGGKGGTIIFKLVLSSATDVTIKRITNGDENYRTSYQMFIGNTLYAAVGGGSDGISSQTVIPLDYPYQSPRNGADGGGTNGQDGFGGSQQGASLGGKGAQGSVGGLKGTHKASSEGGDGNDGSSYPISKGGLGILGSSNEGNAGCGYAGGGSGGYEIISNIINKGAGGGGSSYVISSGITLIENSQGTNDDIASMQITYEGNYTLKTPLVNSYTNPVLYRSYLTTDTTNHRASFTSINSKTILNGTIRILVKDLNESFFNIASWFDVAKDMSVDTVRIMLSPTSDFDESKSTSVVPKTYTGITINQIQAELGTAIKNYYAVIEINLKGTSSGTNYIYKMLGVVD